MYIHIYIYIYILMDRSDSSFGMRCWSAIFFSVCTLRIGRFLLSFCCICVLFVL